MSGSHPSSWFLLTLREVSTPLCTYAAQQQLGCSHPECKQKDNSVTTGVMIKFIREMSPSNAFQSEVRKHMKIPCSCAFPRRSPLLYLYSFTADQMPLTACMLAATSFVWIYLFICCAFGAPNTFCWKKVSECNHNREFSGKEPSSTFLHTDLEMRAVQKHYRGFKAKSQVIFHLIFKLQFLSIEALPCDWEVNRNWFPLYYFCVCGD